MGMSLLGRVALVAAAGILTVHAAEMSRIDAEEHDIDARHAPNVARILNLLDAEIGKPTGYFDPAVADRYRAMFNQTKAGFAFYNDREAYDYVNLIGHAYGNVSDRVAFEFGAKVESEEAHSAKLIFFARAATNSKMTKALVTVMDQEGNLILSHEISTPRAPAKKYTVHVKKDAIKQIIASSEGTRTATVRIAVKCFDGEDLLMIPGRDKHQQHMGMVLEIKFPSALLKSRNRRDAEYKKILRGQCDEDQDTCCPHVRTFNFRKLNYHHVIAPESFDSVVCRGICTEDHALSYKHTVHRQRILESVRAPCCSPTKYESQIVLWLDPNQKDENGNYAFYEREIPNFTATRCGCD